MTRPKCEVANMSEYHEEQSDTMPGDQTEGGGQLPPELTEQTDPAFVVETKPGRNASMLLVALVMIGAAVLYLMRLRAGPQSAGASAPEVNTAKVTITEFLTDGGKNLKAMRDLLKNTEKIVQQFALYPSRTQIRLEDLKTNPFRFSKPKAESTEDDRARLLKEQQRRKEKEREEVAKAAQQLQLQSVIHSGTFRTCIISSRSYTEGQLAEGFLVERITPNSVVVKKAGYRFELRMQP
jgi:hypothetical protein